MNNNIKQEDIEALNALSYYDLHEFLRHKIENNKDIDIVKYVLSNKDLKAKININTFYKLLCEAACKNNDIEIIKYVCNLEDGKQLCYNAVNDYKGWRCLCEHNDIKIIHYLLLESPIKSNFKRINIESLLSHACSKDKVDIMKFVFDNKLLPHNNNNPQIYRLLVNAACAEKSNKTIEYILNSPIFTPYTSILKVLELSVRYNNKDLQEYIIFQEDFKPNKKTKKYIEANPELKQMYSIKQFNDQLKNNLEQKLENSSTSKMKI